MTAILISPCYFQVVEQVLWPPVLSQLWQSPLLQGQAGTGAGAGVGAGLPHPSSPGQQGPNGVAQAVRAWWCRVGPKLAVWLKAHGPVVLVAGGAALALVGAVLTANFGLKRHTVKSRL